MDLKELFEDKGIMSCEYPRPHKCSSWCLNFAHRHKRNWYKGQESLLTDFRQVALLCQKSHTMIEFDRNLTEEIFMELRGEE